MIKIRNPKDFWSGIMFCAFGGAGIVMSKSLSFGTLARMGPAYFPTIIGGMLIVLGLFIALRGLIVNGKGAGNFHLRTLLLILLSITLFGLALEYFGLLCAVFTLVALASSAGHDFRWRETLIVAVCLALGSVAVFVFFLKLQIPIWPSF